MVARRLRSHRRFHIHAVVHPILPPKHKYIRHQSGARAPGAMVWYIYVFVPVFFARVYLLLNAALAPMPRCFFVLNGVCRKRANIQRSGAHTHTWRVYVNTHIFEH